MASLYKNPESKYWSITYSFRGKRFRKSLRTQNRKLAEEALAKFNREIERAYALNLPLRVWSGEDIASQWQAHLEANGKKGKPNADRFRRFIRFLGNPNPQDIYPADVERWKNERTKKVSRSTVKRDCECVFSAFQFALDMELIARDPSAKIKKPTIAKKLVQFLTNEEAQNLLVVASEYRNGEAYEMIAVALYTGMRQAEVRFLNVENIDRQSRLIQVVGKEGWTPKTDEEREIPIADELLSILDSFLDDHPGGPLFQHSDGSRLGRTYCTRILRSISRLAELTCTWHTLRHTFASLLVQAGAPIYAVSKLLGHASYATTERHYARLLPSERHEEVNLLSFNGESLPDEIEEDDQELITKWPTAWPRSPVSPQSRPLWRDH